MRPINRFASVELEDYKLSIINDLKVKAEEVARVLDRVPSREASHALTLLEGAVMFGTRALAKAPVVLDKVVTV